MPQGLGLERATANMLGGVTTAAQIERQNRRDDLLEEQVKEQRARFDISTALSMYDKLDPGDWMQVFNATVRKHGIPELQISHMAPSEDWTFFNTATGVFGVNTKERDAQGMPKVQEFTDPEMRKLMKRGLLAEIEDKEAAAKLKKAQAIVDSIDLGKMPTDAQLTWARELLQNSGDYIEQTPEGPKWKTKKGGLFGWGGQEQEKADAVYKKLYDLAMTIVNAAERGYKGTLASPTVPGSSLNPGNILGGGKDATGKGESPGSLGGSPPPEPTREDLLREAMGD